ncbi:hypothetical protein [Pseudomonas sp. FP2335]|uniref:hypothetical protein n=1 Tax=Pseudomonas sp. FP2335 TaxID=2954092 RepID=UPI00351F6324
MEVECHGRLHKDLLCVWLDVVRRHSRACRGTGAARDLMGVYQQAVLNDARLSAARHAFGAQREAVAQALAGLLPTLSAGATVEAVRLWCGNERFQQPCLTTV